MLTSGLHANLTRTLPIQGGPTRACGKTFIRLSYKAAENEKATEKSTEMAAEAEMAASSKEEPVEEAKMPKMKEEEPEEAAKKAKMKKEEEEGAVKKPKTPLGKLFYVLSLFFHIIR